MNKTLYIIRGIPGSGKSTLVKYLTPYYVETDDYFTDSNGVYDFKLEKVPESHKWALNELKFLMELGVTTVAVLDAFIKLDTMKPYKELGKTYGYNVIEILVKSNFTNIHNISEDRMNEIRSEFEFTPFKDS